MGYSVELSYSAERDRDEIVRYLIDVLDARQAAARFFDELDATIALLEIAPEGCSHVDDERLSGKGYRKAPFMNYLAVFRVEGNRVRITRIFHARQDYARLL